MKNESQEQTNHAVRYDKFGGTEVLYIAETPMPEVGSDKVLVRIKAAGINPGETSIRLGKLEHMFKSTLPTGQGSDFAGTITAIGDQVKDFKIGDEVIGFSNNRNAQAEYIAVGQDQLVIKPEQMTWEQAGGLFVAGTTAYAGVDVLSLSPGDVVIISGAAGGVGSIAVQIAKNLGVEVIGFASEANHEWLKKHGVIPVTYGEDNLKAVQEVLDGRTPSALFDVSGNGYVKLGIDLGIPKERINTIIDFEAASTYSVNTAGNSAGASAAVMEKLTKMIDEGKLEILVAGSYPLAEVKAAYDDLASKHTHGKIVLIP
ncbi:NADP-dependent oxidoreductase [Pedobacter sp. L105]|uniref:NADP-dependent oxidoreductase n=1 Tax=Pedobacter sp. L105 TaxID=1641871 RepID=UPI00131D022F|nr:NADP-dependent oxidoreductase [Pedobacter sp. L105]